MDGKTVLMEIPDFKKHSVPSHHLYEMASDISISSIHFLNFVNHSVMSVFQLPEFPLHKRDRTANVSLARQTAMYLLHTLFGFSFTVIGAHFSRNRKTVAYACSAIENLRDDPTMDRVLSTMETALAPLKNKSRQ
jgi:chromosomal replication initiation ATPase DnaA